ncbi:hypothetical protein MMC12_006399 [Toensbergia leucococca]|nr:hypothetical protein [Toensbergia leucococca]
MSTRNKGNSSSQVDRLLLAQWSTLETTPASASKAWNSAKAPSYSRSTAWSTASNCSAVEIEETNKKDDTVKDAKNGKDVEKDTKHIPCTFPNCNAKFASLVLLKRHKNERHDYCKRCDLDFEDDAAYLKHKIFDIENHITCCICSEDFHSEGGRDRHFRQAHAADQNIACPGCGEIFVRAGGLVNHIEKNTCPFITSKMFWDRRGEKEIYMHQLSQLANDTESLLGAESEAGDSVSGGVPLDRSSIIDKDDEDYASVFPTLTARSEVGGENTNVAIAESVNESSDSDATETQDQFDDTEGKDQVIEGLETMSIKTPPKAWASAKLSSSTLFPNAPKTPALNWNAPIEAPRVYLPQTGTEYGRISTMVWNPYNCFNSVTNTFKCPHPKCMKFYKSADALKQHLDSPTHSIGTHRCPACLKIFKTPTALTSHMESSSQRCKIKETGGFDHVLNLVSAGYLGVAGVHSDGTVKIEASKPAEPVQPRSGW